MVNRTGARVIAASLSLLFAPNDLRKTVAFNARIIRFLVLNESFWIFSFHVRTYARGVSVALFCKMKRPRQSDQRKNHKRFRSTTLNDNRVTELLKICLQKVCEMQEELRRSDDDNDPEAAGYAACATETLRFLTAEGVPSGHPIVKELEELFTRNKNV